ncbi:uncharacterized protein LOC128763441 [Synchiropus splendidus]|uniref:uncharacterized protein LOC128763441 n=1 Tax=Synchiropus splendidus TaxID=270530 RepID=UPI00237DE473|nr:uncharacterized protein LOC128763441 [Synchiropus splendidus]
MVAPDPVYQSVEHLLVPSVKLKTLLVSAYLEHRLSPRKVRVIAVVLRNETSPYRCRLRCLGKPDAFTDGYVSVHRDHFDYPYGTSDIMCSLPPDCQLPSHVSVTSTRHKELCDQRVLEVKNQEPKQDSFKSNFTVCWSTMFDFNNVLQLVQSLEMLQVLGANKVAIYKTNCSADTQRVLNYYTQRGLVEVIPWNMSQYLILSRGWQVKKDPGDLHYFGQLAALNDCIYRYMYQSRYLAMHDVDELILPQAVSSWPELLPQLTSKYKFKNCFTFENNVFPNTVSLTPPTSPGSSCWSKVTGVNILAHLHQEPYVPNWDCKVIVDPRSIHVISVHIVLDPYNACSWVDRNEARLYHTRGPKQPHLTQGQLVYDSRMVSYSEKLKVTVDAVLRETGLLPQDSAPC